MGSQRVGHDRMTEQQQHTECIMPNVGLYESQARIKIARRNINNLKYADDSSQMTESKEELKSLLMKVKEEGGKSGLKVNTQKTDHGIWPHNFKTNRWGNNGNTNRLYILGLQKSLGLVSAATLLKDTCSLKEKLLQI